MAKSKKRSKNKGLKILGLLVVLAALALGALSLHNYLLKNRSNIKGKTTLFVRPEDNFQTLMDSLADKLIDIGSFVKVAEKENLPAKIHAGRYQLDSTTTNIKLVRSLKYGYQSPLMLPINGRIRTRQILAYQHKKKLCADSASFMQAFNNLELLSTLGVDTTTLLTLIIPESYEFYWTVSPEEFLKRMKKEYDAFWTPERLQKARDIKLTQTEVSILASIVYGESNHVPEYPKIASVYLNRLRQGWKLCADPTVVYATGDFTLRRVLKKHLQIDSPYNTYKINGLPPGPIMIPTKDCLDGVLNEEKTDYMYFCASPKFNGTHNFARTGAEHSRNAKAYVQALDSLNRAKKMAEKKNS